MYFGERCPVFSAEERCRKWQQGQTLGAPSSMSTLGLKTDGRRRRIGNLAELARCSVPRHVGWLGTTGDGEEVSDEERFCCCGAHAMLLSDGTSVEVERR